LTDEDKVDMEKMKDRLYANEELMSFFNPDNTRDNVKERFDEEVDNELLDFINTKLELYNKLTDDRANETFKRLWFNELYNQKVRGINY
jgi:type I restriction enzyme R subunit